MVLVDDGFDASELPLFVVVFGFAAAAGSDDY
jgi:hypothetical protein